MLFQHRFHPGIQSGAVTVTYRAWQSPRVRPGRQYSCAPIGKIEVDAVVPVALQELGDREARGTGHASGEELVAALRASTPRRLQGRSRVYRVEFHFAGKAAPAPPPDRSVQAVNALVERLARMDGRSRREPWTAAVLRTIARHPRVAASRLAPQFDRETPAFKADVRKLKALGLTQSHEVGYELTALGKALLERLGC